MIEIKFVMFKSMCFIFGVIVTDDDGLLWDNKREFFVVIRQFL